MKQTHVRYRRRRSLAKPDRQSDENSTRVEHLLDDALEQTFPASDPVALTMPHEITTQSRGSARNSPKH